MKIALLLLICLNPSRPNIFLPVINDLIENFNNTQIILGLLCHKNDAKSMLQEFSTKYQVNILPRNISAITYPRPPSHVTYVLDASCNTSNETLAMANDAKLFASPFKWIIYHDEEFNITTLQGFDFLVDSDVTLVVKENEGFIVTKVYKQQLNSPLLEENIGTWTRSTGFTGDYEKVTYKRRRNLKRTILNSCIVLTNNDSIHHLTDRRDIHIDSIAKVNYVLVEHLSDTINASLNYSIQSTWGYKDKNSSWSGMIGELTRNEADIGGTALFLTVDRVDIIDYIAMTTTTKSKFIFREPKLSYVSNVFIMPFDLYVWLSTGALFLVTAVILYIVTKWEWKKKTYTEISNQSNELELRSSWIEIVFETFAAFCQQGTHSVPYSIPGRVTLIFLLVSFMFLYTSYSANIVALLQSSSNSIQTLKDILKSRLDVGVHDTVFNHFYFPNATEPIRRGIYVQKVAPPGQKPRFYSLEEGIRRMRNGLFAFHVETGPGYKFVTETFREDEKCGLHEIQFLQVQDPWLAIQKNSSYKKMLKVGLRQLQENGIQSREVGLIYTKKPQCLSRGNSFISVGIIDCYAAAVVFVGGLAAATVVLILEIYVHYRLKYYLNKRKKISRNS